jgi:hypothetical protein
MHNFNCGKEQPKNVVYFFNFQKTAQSKQSPNGRKLAQSGHTGSEVFCSALSFDKTHLLWKVLEHEKNLLHFFVFHMGMIESPHQGGFFLINPSQSS